MRLSIIVILLSIGFIMLLSEFNQFKETGYAYPTRTFVMIGIFLFISLIIKNKYLSSLFIFLLFTEGYYVLFRPMVTIPEMEYILTPTFR